MPLLSQREVRQALAWTAPRIDRLRAEWPQDAPLAAPADPVPVAFIQAVASYQAAHGLAVDGKAGPATLGMLRAMNWVRPDRVPPGSLRAFGRWHPVRSDVVVEGPWSVAGGRFDFEAMGHTHGQFSPGQVEAVMLHDTVTRTTDAAYRVLLRRKSRSGKNLQLSTALLLDPSGVVYQAVPDLSDITRHASGWSERSLGLDVVALLDPALIEPDHPLRRPSERWAPAGYVDYTTSQRRVLPLLVRSLCAIFDLPYAWLRDPSGRPATRPYGRRLDVPESFRGVLAHGQVSKRRWDGNRALEVLEAGPA